MSKEPLPKNTGEAQQNIELEQYKMLVDSIHKMNETRESSNNFWIGVNGLGVSAVAYLREVPDIPPDHKTFLFVTLIIVGILFCLSWLSYLGTIKRSVETRSEILVKLEQNFPLSVFTKAFSLSAENVGKAALTVKEMLVPLLFLSGYLFFAVLLLFFPQEVISNL